MDLSDWHAIDQTDRPPIGLTWNTGMVKVCQVQFWWDRFFIHFPYHPSERGVIARCEVGAGSETTVSYPQTGFVVVHRVKCSHPPGGTAHFSQDGRMRTEVRTQASPMHGSSDRSHLLPLALYPPAQRHSEGGNDRANLARLDSPWRHRGLRRVHSRHRHR